MADRRISDFPTLPEADDNDILLVSSQNDTYGMPVKVLKDATRKVAEEALDNAATAIEKVEDIEKKTNAMDIALSEKVDGAYVENGYLYLTSNDEIVAGPLGPFSGAGGGGGGGGGGGYTVTLTNLLDSRVLTVSDGAAVYLTFQYASADDNGDDGPGVGTITVNGVKMATLAIPQGTNMVDVSSYLVSGSNNVRLKVENSEGSSRSLSYTVTVVSLSIGTTFDALGTYSGPVAFNYTVAGSGTKTVNFLVDGTSIGTEEVTSSGRSRTYTIPAQTVGAHVLTVYAEVTASGATVTSNTITVGMLWISAAMSSPAVLSTFNAGAAVQGDILTLPYMVYDPLSESAAVTLKVLNPDGTVYSSKDLTVDRTAQSWTVQNYPTGAVKFQISCGTAVFEKTVTVSESSIIAQPVTDALALYFDPTGRSNYEDNPGTWTAGDIAASFMGVGFSGADGWLVDDDGAAILRLLPGSSMTIPFQLFASDARDLGATIEVEMATHNVRDYDTVVMSCLSGGRGFKIASQYAQLTSEASDISMQFKEDEKVRVTFVVEPRNLHRLISVYVDGIMCGATQYPAADDFEQHPAAGITIGAQSAGIDLYRIRLYTKGLTRHEVLDNYIADRALPSERVSADARNDIFNLAEEIVISKLPASLPYMIIACAELPQYKGDKKICSITYVDPLNLDRSFTAEGAEIDVQGTSSAGYKKKNFKIKYKAGLTYTASGQHSDTYQLRENSIPAKAFCMKADVASSEGANNVELVRFYNDTVPYQTPPQQADSRVRVGIDGLPCVIFWQNPTTGEIRFWGKYNFNDEKSSEQVYGLTTGCESWEICNNTSDRVIFKSADFSGTAWQDDFEARYPEDSTDCTKLAAMCAWVASTDRGAVSSAADKAARLQKFKTEFEDHFVKAPMLFYYLFTEVFLMVDSRAKNFFPSTFDGVHWLPLPYDMDTAVGINNEGQLVFDYDLEDTDTVDGNNVFNGQGSVLWSNIRDAFGDELKAMYNTLRSGSAFNYAEIISRYTGHQAVWPEAVWNEDAWEKYLEPLEADNDGSYLAMLQGNKASQREWWLYNGFRYRDSKYQCGDAQSNFITLRCYSVGNITVTPYSHIWPRIKYGSYTVTQRGKRNVPVTLACPLDTMNDTEVYIYSADRLAAIGDLSGLQVGYANFSMAGKLQALKLGDGAATYQNTRLTELYVGNNELLASLDVRGCVNLTQTVDLSGCVGIETIQAKGSAVTGFTIPVGGRLKTLELPGTVTNLTLRDQAQLQSLTMEGYTALTTLRIEHTPNVPLDTILTGATNLNRVRLIGVEWTAESEAALQSSIDKLIACVGMDASGNNTAAAVVTGRVNVPSVSAELLAEINDHFPQLVVVANGAPQYMIRYLNWDNTLLYRAVVAEGGNAVNPVTAGYISAPTRANTDDTGYAFRDFGTLPENVHGNASLIAQYDTTYKVVFMNVEAVYATQWVTSGEAAVAPSGTPTRASTAANTFTFVGWSRSPNSVTADSTALVGITAPCTLYAAYSITGRTYTVKFYNGSTLLQTVNNVPYGSAAQFTGTTPVKTGVENTEDYVFSGWSPSNTNIQSDTSCYAQFNYIGIEETITDSWEEIFANISNGTYATKYSIGDTKKIDLGVQGIVAMQIVAFDADTKADGSGKAPITWISEQLLASNHRMNPSLVAMQAAIKFNPTAAYTWAAVEGEANKYESTNAGKSSTNSVGCWKITSTAAGTLTIAYTQSGENNYDYMDLYVNGVLAFAGKNKGQDVSGTYEVALSPDTEIVVAATFTKDSSGDKGEDKGSVTFSSDVPFEIAVPTSTVTIKEAVPAQEGTGTIGGWEKSEMRVWLKETVKPLIPENVRNHIVAVTKTQPAYNTSQNSVTQTTTDDVWIPSYNELFGTSSLYYPYFQNTNAKRQKSKAGSSSWVWWWLRSAYNSIIYILVHSDGSNYTISATSSGAVPLGFCT